MTHDTKNSNDIRVTFTLPEYLKDKLYESTGYLGDTFYDLTINSINENLKNLPDSSIIEINKIFEAKSISHQHGIDALTESSQDMLPVPTSNIWDKLSNSLNENHLYQDRIKTLVRKNTLAAITEEEDPAAPETPKTPAKKRGQIEGDGEDPDADEEQSNGNGSNPNEEQVEGEGEGEDEGQPTDENGNPIPVDPTANLTAGQLLQLELAQSDNKFMTITLYDKIGDLIDTIETIKDKTSSSKTEENLDLFDVLSRYLDYLKILSELIFVMDVNTIYYNFTNIEIEVNDLLNKYLISTKVKTLNNPKISKQERDNITDDLKQNYLSQQENKEEMEEM